MAFNSSNPFGYSGGFEQGREYASPFGASHPEVLGLGALGEAAQAQSAFPVIAGGGGGSPIPGLSQVEVVGGPSQIGNEPRDDTEGLLGGVARQTRIADEMPPANPAQLAGLAAGAAQKGGTFARDLSNLSAFSGGGSLPDFSAGSPGSQVSGGELGLDAPDAGTIPGGATEIGTAAGGAGALAALLGLLAQSTGDPDLAQAAKIAGAGTGALGLASTWANVAGIVSGLGGAAAAGEAAGTAAAATAGATAGAGVGAGAAFAPIAALMLASTISGLFGGEDPVGAGIAEQMAPLMGDYWKFGPKLGQSLSHEQTGLSTLGQALPYVQSKEELGRLINTYKNYVATTNDWSLGEQFGEGGVTDPYRIGNLPGAGGSTHEGGQVADFGPQVNTYQAAIDALLGGLPGERITGGYGDPRPGQGGLEGPDTVRLWSQFLDRGQNTPVYVPQDTGPIYVGDAAGEGGSAQQFVAGSTKGFHAPGEANYGGISYGQPGYDYAGAGWPEPGKFLGSISPQWLQYLLAQLGQGGGAPAAGAPGQQIGLSNLPGLAQVIGA